MIDFTVTDITNAGNVYCSLFFFLIIGLFWRRAMPRQVADERVRGTGWLFLMILLFAVTAVYNGDFFGYQTVVDEYYHGIEKFHLEDIYRYIIEITKQNYLLFRIVVWGGASICFVFATKGFHVNTFHALFVMFLLFVTQFTYARASLAMAIYFWGISVFCNGFVSRKFSSILSGFIIIVASYLFHKSMAVMIFLAFFSLVPINRRTIIPLLLLLLFLGAYIDQYMDSFLNSIVGIGDEQLDEKVEEILEMNMGERTSVYRSIFGIIALVWQYVPFYLSFILITRIMLSSRSAHVSTPMMMLFRVTFMVVVLSTVVLLYSSSALTFFYRYLYMSFIPLSILTVYLYCEGFMAKKTYRTILLVCGGWNFFVFFSYLLRVL